MVSAVCLLVPNTVPRPIILYLVFTGLGPINQIFRISLNSQLAIEVKTAREVSVLETVTTRRTSFAMRG